MDERGSLACLRETLLDRRNDLGAAGASSMSSIPPSADPESSPLQWIPESMALAGISESRVLTTPPPALADLGPVGEADACPGPLSRRAGGWSPRRTLVPENTGSLADAHHEPPGPPSEGPPPSSVLPESTPLALVPESAALSGVPESRPMRAPTELPVWAGIRDPAAVRAIASRVLRLVLSRRRLAAPRTCEPSCEACLAPHLPRAEAFVRAGRPIHFVLPAFPAKSPNPRKVLGTLPDMAEVVALTFLQNLCTRVHALYAPGARITICSDGRVFSDLVGVPDETVSAYGREIKVILEQLGACALDVFNLEDHLPPGRFDELRRALVAGFARPLADIRSQIAVGGQPLVVFNGIARFLFEDMTGEHPAMSRSQARILTKERSYHVIQRSDAWSALVERAFPESLRLSIHPQPAHHEKIGIHLVETLDNWLTPWHAAAVKVGGRYVLMKRYQAERMGAWLVHGGARPSHFVADTLDFDRLHPGERATASAV